MLTARREMGKGVLSATGPLQRSSLTACLGRAPGNLFPAFGVSVGRAASLDRGNDDLSSSREKCDSKLSYNH